MRCNSKITSIIAVAMTAISACSVAFAQTQAIQNRIAQQVMIGGLKVDAAYVLSPNGGIQSYSCPTPQQYVTPDGATQGWACFESTTGVWLLSALPPQQQAPAPAVVPTVIRQPAYQPPVVYPTVIYRDYPRYVYAAPFYPPVYYSSSALIGAAAINAAGQIAAAVIGGPRIHYYGNVRLGGYGHRR